MLAVEVADPLMFGAPLSEPVAAAVAPLGRRVQAQIERWAPEDTLRRAGRSSVHDYHAVSALVARLTGDPSLATGIGEVRIQAEPGVLA